MRRSAKLPPNCLHTATAITRGCCVELMGKSEGTDSRDHEGECTKAAAITSCAEGPLL